jgi:hypothetical protein
METSQFSDGKLAKDFCFFSNSLYDPDTESRKGFHSRIGLPSGAARLVAPAVPNQLNKSTKPDNAHTGVHKNG